MQSVLVEFRLHRKVDSCWPPTALLGKARDGMLLVGKRPRAAFQNSLDGSASPNQGRFATKAVHVFFVTGL